MTAIALWILFGAPAPSPMPTEAPTVAEALDARPAAEGCRARPVPFLRPGVRVVAGGMAAEPTAPSERPSLP